MMTNESPIVQEVRQRAEQISRRFKHDLHEYCQYLREQEKKHPEKMVDQIAVVQSTAIKKSP